eukprot:s996_g7.t1
MFFVYDIGVVLRYSMIEYVTEIMQWFMNGSMENVFEFMAWMVVVVKYNAVALHVTVSGGLGPLRVVVFILCPIDAELVEPKTSPRVNFLIRPTQRLNECGPLPNYSFCNLEQFARSTQLAVDHLSMRLPHKRLLNLNSLRVGLERSVGSSLIAILLGDGMSFFCRVRELQMSEEDQARVRERQDGRRWRYLENQCQLIQMKVSTAVQDTSKSQREARWQTLAIFGEPVSAHSNESFDRCPRHS